MINDSYPPWEKGWEDRLCVATRELGHESFLQFMQYHAGAPYGKILKILRAHLGNMVPLMQLHKLHMQEAIDAFGVRQTAMDSLVRTLNDQVPKGWNKGKRAQEKRAWARAYWVLPTGHNQDSKTIDMLADQVWDEIERIKPPDDWCPTGLNDQILSEAFNRGWPLET